MVCSIITSVASSLCGETPATHLSENSERRDNSKQTGRPSKTSTPVVHLPWNTLEMWTVGESSSMNVDNAATQAGLVVLSIGPDVFHLLY